jgi:hypothetical protein
MRKVFGVVNVFNYEKAMTVVGMKASMRVGSSPGDRRTLRHAPQPNNTSE